MKGLTLTQPWATLVAIGAKTIETRGWSTAYRGPLAIHAGAGLGPVGGLRGLWRLCNSMPFKTVLTRLGVLNERGLIVSSLLPRGAIVAVAHLKGCWPMIYRDGWGYQTWERPGSPMAFVPVSEQEVAFGLWLVGRRAWALAEVQRLPEPVPCRGYQGLWDVPADVAAAIEAQIGGSP